VDLVVLREHEIPFALRALRDVVASSGMITPAERRFIEVVAELHGTKSVFESSGSSSAAVRRREVPDSSLGSYGTTSAAATRAGRAPTNEHPQPFAWTKTADQILAAVARFCLQTSNSGH
jgi:hypothetical protein